MHTNLSTNPETARVGGFTERPEPGMFAVGLALAVALTGAALGIGLGFTMAAAQRRLTPRDSVFVPDASLVLMTKPAGEPLDPEAVASGKLLFVNCVTCHGNDGTGVQGQGKSLVASTFIANLSDDEFLAFLTKGRPASDPLNTTKVDMPPRAGNPALDDDKLWDIIQFVRGLQDPRRVPASTTPK